MKDLKMSKERVIVHMHNGEIIAGVFSGNSNKDIICLTDVDHIDFLGCKHIAINTRYVKYIQFLKDDEIFKRRING